MRRIRLVYGGVLLVAPRPLLRRLHWDTRGGRVAARVLGARHVTEGALLWRHPRLLASVDAIHAATMLAVARAGGVAAPAAAISGALATGLGVAQLRAGEPPA